MSAGEYVIIVDPIWFFNVNNKYNISVHSPSETELFSLDDISNDMFNAIESSIWNDYACSNKNKIHNIVQEECLDAFIKRYIN